MACPFSLAFLICPSLYSFSHASRVPAGGSEEVEIRAATVSAVEALRDALQARWGPGVGSSSSVPVVLPHAVQLDWWLWETGEATRATDPPHHRTLTVYY